MITSFHIITQARTWLGTPFHHQGRLKGIGCDCLGMIIGIADELQLTHDDVLLSSLDHTSYSHTPNTAALLTAMEAYLQEVTDIQPGDIALMQIQNNPQHLGIITDYPGGKLGIIHALSGQGVVEHILSDNWKRRIYRLYRIQA